MTFEDWFDEIEGFALRGERFYCDARMYKNNDKVDESVLLKWLRAAYAVGREHENIDWVQSHWDDGK